MDQYARWQEDLRVDKNAWDRGPRASAIAVVGGGEEGRGGAGGRDERSGSRSEPGNGSSRGGGKRGLRTSDIRQHFYKVFAATLRTGDVDGSLEALKYMSAMGVGLSVSLSLPSSLAPLVCISLCNLIYILRSILHIWIYLRPIRICVLRVSRLDTWSVLLSLSWVSANLVRPSC